VKRDDHDLPTLAICAWIVFSLAGGLIVAAVVALSR
jgi:hypothetical protein